MNKIKIMTVCDNLHAGTGFSEELRNIMYRLVQSNEYEVYWVGLQHAGYPFDVPDTAFPDLKPTGATIKQLGGVGGSDLGFEVFTKHYSRFNPDMVFIIGDPHHFYPYIRYKSKEAFTLVAYSTLDGLPLVPSWKEIFDGVDVPLCMTEWANKEFQAEGFKMGGYIHHGVNWNQMTTNPDAKIKLKRSLGLDPDCIIFGNWDTNQFRKRDDALLRAWKKCRPETKNMKLFLNKDTNCRLGSNLHNLVAQYKIPRETVIFPEDLNPKKERKFFDVSDDPIQHKRMLDLFDVYVSATGGEGFGKCSLEALSLNMPVIITDYAASTEVCAKGSILVPKVGTYRVMDQYKSVDLALIDEDKLAEQIVYLYNNPAERKELGLIAREWAAEFDYDTKVAPAWLDVLDRVNPDVVLANQLLRYSR
jgi:glycosyltransferase involved in cell wall biosynthesis